MIVKDRVTLEEYPNYSIEFGVSSWTQNLPESKQSQSVRNRYDTEDGRFTPHNSSEIPIEDIERIVCECMKRDKISILKISNILREAADSIERQLKP